MNLLDCPNELIERILCDLHPMVAVLLRQESEILKSLSEI